MIPDLVRRLNTIAGSVVTLITTAAVAVNLFVDEVTPSLPDGWQDNAVSIGTAVVSILGFAALAIRRLTEVPEGERSLLPAPGRDHVPPS